MYPPHTHGRLEFPQYLHLGLPLSFQKQGEVIPGEQIHELLNELDTNRNGQVELDEYLQVRDMFDVPLAVWIFVIDCLAFNVIQISTLLFVDEVSNQVRGDFSLTIC